jgi:hypothetical protein
MRIVAEDAGSGQTNRNAHLESFKRTMSAEIMDLHSFAILTGTF